jgi:hypothetical protein
VERAPALSERESAEGTIGECVLADGLAFKSCVDTDDSIDDSKFRAACQPFLNNAQAAVRASESLQAKVTRLLATLDDKISHTQVTDAVDSYLRQTERTLSLTKLKLVVRFAKLRCANAVQMPIDSLFPNSGAIEGGRQPPHVENSGQLLHPLAQCSKAVIGCLESGVQAREGESRSRPREQ